MNPYDDTVIQKSIDDVANEQIRSGLLNVATEAKLHTLITLLFPDGLPESGGPKSISSLNEAADPADDLDNCLM